MQIFSHRRFLALAVSVLPGILFFSCAGGPKAAPGQEDERSISVDRPDYVQMPDEKTGEDTAPVKTVPGEPFPEELPPETPPPPEFPPEEPPEETPPKETSPESIPILGEGAAAQTDLSAFLLDNNPGADPLFAEELAALYLEESAVEGINHDIAFVQMCLETGFLRYGGLVKPEMNNFCGLGALNADNPGESFPSPQIGVRAHIQHLKAYASNNGLNQELVDPRYHWVRYGSAPTVEQLTGTWAADREYGTKIRRVLERLYRFTEIE
ncbi:MAG: glucosaminidase domain-containing protein [Treponema sp.]|jgi:hypothetical protein|nr:glucosaminidase domain-containing protein [Treponema sp.]